MLQRISQAIARLHGIRLSSRAFLLAVVCALPLAALAKNVIQQENAKTAGVTTQWLISDASYAANREIEG
jgi:hypothetical protein